MSKPAGQEIDGLNKWRYLAGGIGVIAVVGFYNALFAFSFFPLTEGWFSAYADLILDGKVPYRDFYLYLTPFYPMAVAAAINLFGDSFLTLRVVGVLVVVTIAVLLYLILSRRFSPSASMVAAITACIYYQSGVAHIPYDFTQVLTLFTLLSTWMLVTGANGVPSSDKPFSDGAATRRILLAGLFATLAFLTKQSNGTFVVVAAWLSCIYLALPWRRGSARLILAFALGCLIPVSVTLVWLVQANALQAFWQQIFSGALAAKGAPDQVLFSWIRELLTSAYAAQMIVVGKWIALAAVASFVLKYIFSFFDKPLVTGHGEFVLLVTLALLCAMVVVNAFLGSSVLSAKGEQFGLQANNYIIPAATSLAAILFVLGTLSCVAPALGKMLSPPVVVLGIMSLGMIWGNGTSAGLSEVGAFVMLALALAGMMDLRLFRYGGFVLVLTLVVGLISAFASKKFDAPYAWWGIAEPSIREAAYFSNTRIMHGLRMSRRTADTVDGLAESLAKAPATGDIFAFPNIPVAYLLANRWPDSKVVVPWFDFLPDAPARAEAARLLATPPAAIVNLKLPSLVWQAHERLFRDGKPLGQRAIQSAISELTERRKLYRLDFMREVSPGCVLEVWHRRERL